MRLLPLLSCIKRHNAGIYNITILEIAKGDVKAQLPLHHVVYVTAFVFKLIFRCSYIYIINVLRNAPETAKLLNRPVLGTITALAVIPEAVRYYHTIHSEINHWSATFQQLRIKLNNANKQTDYTTIMVVAPQCNSSTTTVACNLGITQAQAGLRTVIIDMNMHNPALENIFGLKKKKGIWQLLQGDLSIDDCISKITVDNFMLCLLVRYCLIILTLR